MNTTVPPAEPGGKRGREPRANTAADVKLLLNVKIDGEMRSVPAATMLEAEAADELEKACRDSGEPPVFFLDELLSYSDRERWAILDFIAALDHYRVAVGEARFANLFDATLNLLVGTDDMTLYARAKLAAIETAILLFPEALDGACTRIVDRLRSLQVKGIKVADLLRDARKIQKALQRRPEPAGVSGPRTVLELFPGAPIAPQIVVPIGWGLSVNGVHGTVEDIPAISAPVVILERGQDVHRGTELLTLAWLRDERWQTRVVDRREITDQRAILNLAESGAPVNSVNARALVQYLNDFEATNLKNLPLVRVSHKMGWQGPDGRDGFLWGKYLITAEGVAGTGMASQAGVRQGVRFRGTDQGDDQLAEGFQWSGTIEGWFKAIRPLRHCPRALLGLYGSFVPPLLRIFKSQNFIVDFAGTTTSGKTTTLRAVASVWGRPDEGAVGGAMSSWNATATYRERAPAVCSDMPFILDDTKNVRFPDEVAKTIYSVVQGRGRGRGTVHGLAHQDSCVTVLFSSGERPAVSFTRDGGTRPRVLSFWGSPLGEVSEVGRKRARRLDRQIREHYGLAAVRFVWWLLRHRHQWDEWRQVYEDWVKFYEERAGEDAIAGRMAVHFAALTVASALAHDALALPWEWQNPVEPVWEELTSSTGEADVAANALRLAVDWAVAHRQDFFALSTPRGEESPRRPNQPHNGWVGRWDTDNNRVPEATVPWPWIGIFPHVLEPILAAAGYELDAVIRTWKDNGWLETDSESDKGSRNTKRVLIEKDLARVVAIRREAVEQVHSS